MTCATAWVASPDDHFIHARQSTSRDIFEELCISRDWAFDLTHGAKTLKLVFTREQLFCPLLGCSRSVGNIETLLVHLLLFHRKQFCHGLVLRQGEGGRSACLAGEARSKLARDFGPASESQGLKVLGAWLRFGSNARPRR